MPPLLPLSDHLVTPAPGARGKRCEARFSHERTTLQLVREGDTGGVHTHPRTPVSAGEDPTTPGRHTLSVEGSWYTAALDHTPV